MKPLSTVLLLTVTLFLGCATPQVNYSDLRPPTTATVSGRTLTIHLGSDLMNSACFTRPKARIEGQIVYIVGYCTLQQRSTNFHIRLPASVSPESLGVVWIDPDGARVPVPLVQ